MKTPRYPLAEGQTISQPYTVAYQTQALRLKPGEKVLEVGTGSGYQAAILARMGLRVFTIERHVDLLEAARKRLEFLWISSRYLAGRRWLSWLAGICALRRDPCHRWCARCARIAHKAAKSKRRPHDHSNRRTPKPENVSYSPDWRGIQWRGT